MNHLKGDFVDVLPSMNTSDRSLEVNGRLYLGQYGKPITDVPLEDARILRDIHGWEFTTVPKPVVFSNVFNEIATPLKAPHLKERMIPPPPPARRSITIQGRTYAAPQGLDYLDIPVEDARVMACEGWLDVGPVGPTAHRPVQESIFDPLRGKTYIDTDLQALIIHDGVNWRDMMTGAVV